MSVHRQFSKIESQMEKIDSFITDVVLPEVIACWLTLRKCLVSIVTISQHLQVSFVFARGQMIVAR